MASLFYHQGLVPWLRAVGHPLVVGGVDLRLFGALNRQMPCRLREPGRLEAWPPVPGWLLGTGFWRKKGCAARRFPGEIGNLAGVPGGD